LQKLGRFEGSTRCIIDIVASTANCLKYLKKPRNDFSPSIDARIIHHILMQTIEPLSQVTGVFSFSKNHGGLLSNYAYWG
jgi:hypothetical protein